MPDDESIVQPDFVPIWGGKNKQTTRDDRVRWLGKLEIRAKRAVVIEIGKRWQPECTRTKGRTWKVRQSIEKTLRIPRRGSLRPLPGAAVHELDADGNEWTNNDKEWAGRREKAESRAGVTIERRVGLHFVRCTRAFLFFSTFYRGPLSSYFLRSFVLSSPVSLWTLFSPLLTSSSYTTLRPPVHTVPRPPDFLDSALLSQLPPGQGWKERFLWSFHFSSFFF